MLIVKDIQVKSEEVPVIDRKQKNYEEKLCSYTFSDRDRKLTACPVKLY